MQLVINAGSSSLKWAVFSGPSNKVLSGSFSRIGDARSTFTIQGKSHEVTISDHSAAVSFLMDFFAKNDVLSSEQVLSCVHRVVHGAQKYSQPVLITDEVISDIDEFSALAPLHNPANLSGIRACISTFPNAKQVAVFDTGFHHSIPEEAFLYAIPYSLYEEFGIRKYGFHGISHSYIARQVKDLYSQDVDTISCHLGSGSSITALRRGVSVDTTMGFTPLDGLLMSTRSGELDPEIPLFLMRHKNMSIDDVERLLSQESGLVGLTGFSDVRDVWKEARRGNSRCELALEMMCYRIAFFVNALRTAVPNPRAIVFTAGIGEHAWYIRQRVCEYLGVRIDDSANRANEQRISVDPRLDVLVLRTDEQLQMHLLSEQVI